MVESKIIHLTVSEEIAGLRADIGLAKAGVFNTRSQVKKIFTDKKVFINGKYVKPSQLLQLGDAIQVEVPLQLEEWLTPYDIPLDIYFEDDDVLVLNKPAGLVVHPAAGHRNDTLINALIAHQKTLSPGSSPFRPGLVHRIDKDTSGLLVLAKNEKTHHSLAKQFLRKTVHRIYWAVIFGRPKEDSGTITSYISRSPNDRKKFMATQEATGKHAITHYQVLRSTGAMSLVQLKLETGRTHQIRVHLSSISHPIVGDETYGGKKRANSLASQALKKYIGDMPRFALHAKELGFTHPVLQERLQFDSPWPDDLNELLKLAHLELDV
jgi:23S rRNA pseudouridine1911/1915/1917 synthase